MSILYCSGICQHATIKSADDQAAGLQCTWVYGEASHESLCPAMNTVY